MAVSVEKSTATAQDLQSFIRFLEENYPEEVLRVSREVDPVFEACAILWKLENERRYPAVIFDNINKTVLAVAHAHVNRDDLAGCYRSACERVDRLVERLQQGVADLQLTDIAPVGAVDRPYRSNFEPEAFEAAQSLKPAFPGKP